MIIINFVHHLRVVIIIIIFINALQNIQLFEAAQKNNS